MNNIGLLEFFNKAGYDWQQDKEAIKDICFYTKSRVDNNKSSHDFDFAYGMEQPFILKAIADKIGANNFFEIGTGRGTASYSVSLSKTVSNISTIDIVPFYQKRVEAIGYEQAHVSNSDLRDMIKLPEKNKIKFYERSQFGEVLQDQPKNGYDLFFIDGNHTDFNVIKEDYLMCKLMSADNAVLVWDDYYPNKFAIKDVVSSVLNEDRSLRAFLLSSRGHLFGTKPPELKEGMVVMMKGKAYEDLLS
jgi:predicted O-methyltransferase YrrM